MNSSTFYDILEVSENASSEDIKKSYRKLSLKYHPDKNKEPESIGKFQKITESYETLGDKEKRQQYDMTRNNPFHKAMNMNMGPFGQGGQFDPMEEIFSSLFGMPFGGMAQQGMGMPFGMPHVQIFKNGVPVNMSHGLQKPTPIIKEVFINIDQVLSGGSVPVDIQRWIVENGTKTFENETIYVTLPKGIDDNEILILKDKGNVSSPSCIGDIKLYIKINNNTDLKRQGLDLIYEKKITLKEALCGFSFDIKYINGKNYTINNNSGNIIPPGYRKIIPNMGLTREEHVGNLIIVFEVEFPVKLKEETVQILKDMTF